MEKNRETDRPINRQRFGQRWTDRDAEDIQWDKDRRIQTDRFTQVNRHIWRKIERQTNGQTDKRTDRQKDRQTDRQTEFDRDRHTEMQRIYSGIKTEGCRHRRR
jgi:hypothetical protein